MKFDEVSHQQTNQFGRQSTLHTIHYFKTTVISLYFLQISLGDFMGGEHHLFPLISLFIIIMHRG